MEIPEEGAAAPEAAERRLRWRCRRGMKELDVLLERYGTRRLPHAPPAERQAFARLLAQGWTDTLRKLQPEGPLWTFWDYERNRWPLDKGMRLDHLLLSPAVCDRLAGGGVDRWVRGEDNASDHAPAWIVLDR